MEGSAGGGGPLGRSDWFYKNGFTVNLASLLPASCSVNITSEISDRWIINFDCSLFFIFRFHFYAMAVLLVSSLSLSLSLS